MKPFEIVNNLKEVRAEIARINKAAGHTAFNPSATDALDEVIEWANDEEYPDVGVTELLHMGEV